MTLHSRDLSKVKGNARNVNRKQALLKSRCKKLTLSGKSARDVTSNPRPSWFSVYCDFSSFLLSSSSMIFLVLFCVYLHFYSINIYYYFSFPEKRDFFLQFRLLCCFYSVDFVYFWHYRKNFSCLLFAFMFEHLCVRECFLKILRWSSMCAICGERWWNAIYHSLASVLCTFRVT